MTFAQTLARIVYIPLSKGKVAVIDEDDLDLVLGRTWHTTAYGYAATKVKQYYNLMTHVVIANPPPGYVVDHINGDGLDNRRENLRVCTHNQNMKNCKLYKNNTSGFKGVYKYKDRWQAYIKKDKKMHSLGIFQSKEDAATAYNFAAAEHYGDFARFNVVDQPWLNALMKKGEG